MLVAHSFRAFTMKFTLIIFALLSIFLILPVVSGEEYKSCKDRCGDDFDEVVCASNGDELQSFSGRCRLQQFNDCYNESNVQKLFQ